MAHKIIFLNGPPGSGKDIIARHLYVLGGRHRKFADPLKQAARGMFGVSDALWKVLEKEGSQAEKNMPREEFFELSWREILIWLSEDCMKPKFGRDIFGELASQRLANENFTVRSDVAFTVFSDCGFTDEVRVVSERFGPQNCQVWRIHRPGTSYEGDSRGYITVPRVSSIEFYNEHDMEMMKIQVRKYLYNFLGITVPLA